MIHRLVVIEGPEVGREFCFEEADSFLVGRSPKAHLVLDPRADRYISRTHCLIDIRPPRCIINDLGSTNGTYLNEERIQRAELQHGDVIRVGRTRIRVEVSHDVPEHGSVFTRPVVADVVDHNAPSTGWDRGWQPPEASQPWQPPVGAEPEAHRSGEPASPASQPVSPGRASMPAQDSAAQAPRCCECGGDPDAKWDDDELRQELVDSLYLCPSCEYSLTRRSTESTQLGPYTMLSELGRGGMGVVYKAVHHTTRRVCAIKQILPSVAHDEKTYRQFEREISIQSKVVHPHLVRLLDHGLTGDVCFFVSEYLPGGDAGKLVRKVYGGPVDPSLALRLIAGVLQGLEALHQHGYVHRDLKPANILLSRPQTQGFGDAKITDYGLAKSFEEAGNSLFDLTREGEAAGSLMFMPPEQILNYRFVKPPVDVYAAGVSLYFLLTAEFSVNFPGSGQESQTGRNPIEALIEDASIPILQRRPELPASIARVVDKAVQKQEDQRYASAAAFHDELVDAAVGEGLM